MYQLDQPVNVVEILEHTIATFPDRPFLGMKNKQGKYEWTTYGDFGRRVDNLRSGLSQIGVQKDDAVGIVSNNSIAWAVCFFATQGLSARFVPMYEAETIKTRKYIIADSSIKVLFVTKKEKYDEVKELLASTRTLKKIIRVEGDGPDTLADVEQKGASQRLPSIHPDASVIGALIYTSGTTGDPKGVLLSQGNLSSNSHARLKIYPGFGESERTLSILPWAHVFGLGELITFCQIGASIGIAESAATIADDIIKVQPTFLVAVPRVFNKVYDGIWSRMNKEGGLAKKLFTMGIESAKKKRELAAQGKSSFATNLKFAIADKVVFAKIREKLGGRLKGSMTGSAVMNAEISRFFWDIGIPLFDCYGLTETTPAVTMNGPLAYRLGSVGKVIDKCRVVIDRSVVEAGATDGEIIAYGPNVMQGYHNKPDATKAVMTPDGGFRTGDRGRIDADGFLFVTGRLKEQFKLANGKYVFPASLEEDIRLNHFIENALVYGEGREYTICIAIPDFHALKDWAEENGLSSEPQALIESEQAKKFLEGQIVNTLKNTYGNYEIPRKFIFINETFTVENGTLTQTMKLKRGIVIDRYKEQIESLYAS